MAWYTKCNVRYDTVQVQRHHPCSIFCRHDFGIIENGNGSDRTRAGELTIVNSIIQPQFMSIPIQSTGSIFGIYTCIYTTMVIYPINTLLTHCSTIPPHHCHWLRSGISSFYPILCTRHHRSKTVEAQQLISAVSYWGNGCSCSSIYVTIVWLLVATLHVGMTGFQDGGYTQLAQLHSLGQNIIHSPVARVVYGWWALAYKFTRMPGSTENVPHRAIWRLRGSLDENASFSSLSRTGRLIWLYRRSLQ